MRIFFIAGGGILLGYRFMRKLMLDQTWNHEKGYIKPLHFPSGKMSKTFYFSAKNQSNFHYGILGELKQATGDVTEVISAVDRHFREAVYDFDDIHQVANTLCDKLDDSHLGIELSFQLWARHEALDHIPVLSMGLPAMKLITCAFEDVFMTFDAEPFQSQKKPSFKCALVPIAQTQYLIFSTDTCYLPECASKQSTMYDSIFELSRHLCDTICRRRNSHPASDGEISIVLMDLHDYTVTCESTFYGLENCDSQIETILSTIPPMYDPFAVKLIVSELLMNAYKHGNGVDQTLPIKVIVSVSDEELVLEVLDMSIRTDAISIKTDLNPENILDEHGRGLFLVNAFSDSLTIDNNSIVARIKCKKTER